MAPDARIIARAEGPAPAISVCVSTRNRAQLLPRLIACIEEQTHADLELVIVDDASEDATPDELERLASTTRVRITAAQLGVQSGPAVGRNTAWRLARAPVIAFTDDDCQPTPKWLEQGLAALNEGAGVAVGRVEPDPEQRDKIGPFSRTLHVFDASYLATCNIFYRRSDLEAVGGFDEGFPRWPAGGEDTDLGWRVRDLLGRTVTFVSEALVHHDVRASDFRAKARESLRWTGIPRLVALHPGAGRRMLHRGLFWKWTHEKTLLACLGISSAFVFPPGIAFVIPWIRMKRRQEREEPGPAAWRHLPGLFAIDVLEVVAMIRGSIEHRTFVL